MTHAAEAVILCSPPFLESPRLQEEDLVAQLSVSRIGQGSGFGIDEAALEGCARCLSIILFLLLLLCHGLSLFFLLLWQYYYRGLACRISAFCLEHLDPDPCTCSQSKSFCVPELCLVPIFGFCLKALVYAYWIRVCEVSDKAEDVMEVRCKLLDAQALSSMILIQLWGRAR